ncbi:MAG: ankyrin repeat domain-containing protein [Planctomycetaceae bacterium]|nr:ankyrin repeat domain-containing protein [Planctomycetaceae bacterium]
MKDGLDANATAPCGYGLLALAVNNAQVECVKVLLARKPRLGYPSVLAGACNSLGLHGISIENRLEIVRLLIAAGADLNASDGMNRTPLTTAISTSATSPPGPMGQRLLLGQKAVDILLAAGAAPNYADRSRGAPLLWACERGLAQTAKSLLDRGAKPGGMVSGLADVRVDALHAAACGGYNDIVALLLARGAKVDEEDGYHRTALYYAAASGFADTVDLLIAHGANIEAVTDGRTPLGWAASDYYLTLAVETLLSRGAKVHPAGAVPPLRVAACGYGTDSPMVAMLLGRGAKLDEVSAAALGRLDDLRRILDANRSGTTRLSWEDMDALGWAHRHRHEAEARLLIERGAKPNPECAAWLGMADAVAAYMTANPLPAARDAEEDAGPGPWGALMREAASGGRNAIIELLLARGYDLRRDSDCLEYAAQYRHRRTVKLLLDRGANVKPPCAALNRAAEAGDIEMARLLLSKGADINGEADISDSGGWPPLPKAISAGQVEMARFLLSQGADAPEDGKFIEAMPHHDKNALSCNFKLFMDYHKKKGHTQQALNEALAGVAESAVPEYVETLLAMGANPKGLDHWDRPLLWFADDRTAKLLLERGAEVDILSACALGRTDQVRAMLKADPKLARVGQDPSGVDYTPLRVAAMHGRIEIMTLLLDQGVTPDRHIVSSAIFYKQKDALALLLERGAGLGGDQALHYARHHGGGDGYVPPLVEAATFNAGREIMQLLKEHRARRAKVKTQSLP